MVVHMDGHSAYVEFCPPKPDAAQAALLHKAASSGICCDFKVWSRDAKHSPC